METALDGFLDMKRKIRREESVRRAVTVRERRKGAEKGQYSKETGLSGGNGKV